MVSATGFQAAGGWQWPDDLPAQTKPVEEPFDPHVSAPKSAAEAGVPEADTQEAEQSTGEQTSDNQPHNQRHWRPRTCRICLETVLPSYNPPSDNLPGFFQREPSVTYDSEGGRLIRPCKCKGSSRYVHESCLQEWRHADPSYGRRNFWNCPTCGFQYRLERMQWGRWISSTLTQLVLTAFIFTITVFVLGFVADPIINIYLDPYETITSMPTSRDDMRFSDDDDDASWLEHFIKGFASLGLLGFVKVFFTLSPWQWFNLRGTTGFMGGSGRMRNTGRDRVNNLNMIVVVLGVCTFIYTVWKGVRAWSRRVLEKASERVIDVQGEDDGDDDDTPNEHDNT